MCPSKLNTHQPVAHIDGRPVLQQTSNRINSLPDGRSPPKKALLKSPPHPVSPETRSPAPRPVPKRANYDPNRSIDKASALPRRNLKSVMTRSLSLPASPETERSMYNSSLARAEASGSIAATRKEQVAMQQQQRKMKVAHYGRVGSSSYRERKVVPLDPSALVSGGAMDEKRCSFITPNSDPIFVAYHDEEWGVPVHDDRLLFELLVLTGAQVGSDWSSVLKKREIFRAVFARFDADTVSKFTEKKITSLSTAYGIELSLIRGAVDNSKQILEVAKQFGSFSGYLWRFVNKTPITTEYKRCQKIPTRTSKSESISKDMVKRGFRSVGPTVIHSFMQAAGLTNDHLVTCPRHLRCSVSVQLELDNQKPN